METRIRSIAFDGETWAVREQLLPDDSRPSLVFSTDRIARRVREYPAEWYSLAATDLSSIAWNR